MLSCVCFLYLVPCVRGSRRNGVLSASGLPCVGKVVFVGRHTSYAGMPFPQSAHQPPLFDHLTPQQHMHQAARAVLPQTAGVPNSDKLRPRSAKLAIDAGAGSQGPVYRGHRSQSVGGNKANATSSPTRYSCGDGRREHIRASSYRTNANHSTGGGHNIDRSTSPTIHSARRLTSPRRGSPPRSPDHMGVTAVRTPLTCARSGTSAESKPAPSSARRRPSPDMASASPTKPKGMLCFVRMHPRLFVFASVAVCLYARLCPSARASHILGRAIVSILMIAHFSRDVLQTPLAPSIRVKVPAPRQRRDGPVLSHIP